MGEIAIRDVPSKMETVFFQGHRRDTRSFCSENHTISISVIRHCQLLRAGDDGRGPVPGHLPPADQPGVGGQEVQGDDPGRVGRVPRALRAAGHRLLVAQGAHLHRTLPAGVGC